MRLLLLRRGSSMLRRNLLRLRDERRLFETVFPANMVVEIEQALRQQCTIYCGFDPTAASLHIGHLLPLMALLHAQRAGHRPIALIGDATAKLGDPTGRSAERPLLSDTAVDENASKIHSQLTRIFHNHQSLVWPKEHRKLASKPLEPIHIVRNSSWYEGLDAIQLMRRCGRLIKVRDLLRRDSVKDRLQSTDPLVSSLSYMEFSYQVFQAYDWYQLHQRFGCTAQIGGNDQVGNIVSGYEFLSRASAADAPKRRDVFFALTTPLMLDTRGRKIGKTPAEPDSTTTARVWLDANLTSAFDFYQNLLRLPDTLVDQWLRWFTFLPTNEISDLLGGAVGAAEGGAERKKLRRAQRVLAERLTELVHGEAGVASAQRATRILFDGDARQLVALDQPSVFATFPAAHRLRQPLVAGCKLIDVTLAAGLFPDPDVATDHIRHARLLVNEVPVTNPELVLLKGCHILDSNLTVLRRLRSAKNTYHPANFKAPNCAIVEWI